MYHDAPQQVTLLCENRTMRNVIDHFGEDVATEVMDASHFRATVDVAPTPPFFSWVFTFGGAIRIEGPAEVLAKMRDMPRGCIHKSKRDPPRKCWADPSHLYRAGGPLRSVSPQRLSRIFSPKSIPACQWR